jgi:orotate phosphoribosyltransferase
MTDASIIAEKLLQIQAVRLQPQQPFTWASGWKSPIYCDNRKILSHPFVRDFVKSELCNIVFDKFSEADIVAGVATAGIPWGIMIADQLKLPFVYVRPTPKEHGLGNQIEGEVLEGQRVIIVEDLISTGKSSLQVADVLKTKGIKIEGMISIFNYRFPAAKHAFEEAGVRLHSLTDYPALLESGLKNGTINSSQHEVLLKWQENPAFWTGNS